MPHKHTNPILRHVEMIEISWISHLNTNVSIIMSNVNPLNMKLQRHWIVEAIWFSEISVAVLSRQFHYPGSWKEVLLWLWSVAHDILGSRNCNWCPSLATLWWVAGLTGRSWDSLLCSGTNWCVLVLTGVFRDSLVCPGTHWCVLGLSVVSWDSLVCPGTLWHVLDSLMCSGSLWCFLGLIGVSWDSLVCPGTYWNVLGLSGGLTGMSWYLLVCCAANLNREQKRLLWSMSRSKASDSTMQSWWF